MGGSGGFIDDMPLTEEFGFGGVEDRFCADTWGKLGFEGAP